MPSPVRLTQGLTALLTLLSSMASTGAAAAVNAAAHPTKASAHDLAILATTYNGTVLPYSVDASSSSFTAGSAAFKPNTFGTNPGWVCWSPSFSSSAKANKDRVLYIADGASSNIFATTLDAIDPLQLGRVGDPANSDGQEAVSCSVGFGPSANLLFVANYGAGTLAWFQLDPKTGAIDESSRKTYQFKRQGTGPVPDRQDHSYAHQTQISPDGKFVYVCDLGADAIHRFEIAKGGSVEYKGDTQVKAGSGPRHIIFYPHPSAKQHGPASAHGRDAKVNAYLASELDSTVSAFSYDSNTGALKLLGKPLYPFPPGTPLSGPNILPTNRTTAEIEASPDGRFVYVSNRGDKKEDHISIFARNANDGTLTFLKWVPSGGLLPRHFSLSSPADGSGEFLVSAHQDSQDVVLFRRDVKSGDLSKVKRIQDTGVVVFAGFLPK